MSYGPSLFQYQIATEPVSTSPETVTEDRWHQAWSEPAKSKTSILAAQQQFLAFIALVAGAPGTGNLLWYQPWTAVMCQNVLMGEG